MTAARRRVDDDGGVGTISTILGVTMFLVFMFMAVQITIYLYATTLATDAAFEAARIASAEGPSGLEEQRRTAEEYGRTLLGSYDPRAEVTVNVWPGDVVEARVVARPPVVFAPILQQVPGLGLIQRSVILRSEGEV